MCCSLMCYVLFKLITWTVQFNLIIFYWNFNNWKFCHTLMCFGFNKIECVLSDSHVKSSLNFFYHSLCQFLVKHYKFYVKWSESCSVVSDSLQPHGLYRPWNSPGQKTGVGSFSLLHGIFWTQGLNPGLLHCRQILYQLSHIN